MVKVKVRTLKAFVGRRRNPKLKTRAKREPRVEEEVDKNVGQQHSIVEQQTSASALKLNYFGVNLDTDVDGAQDEEKLNDCYLFAQKSCLEMFICHLLCPECTEKKLCFEVKPDKSFGFSSYAVLSCSACQCVILKDYLCKRLGNTQSTRSPFEINVLSTLAFRGIGCGYSAMKNWCGTMNMPNCLSQDSYHQNQLRVAEASKNTFNDISKKSVKAIFNAYSELGVEPDDEGVLDIGVSFDGSWQKRGHSSHNGIASVIDLITGLPVDYEVLSNFCMKCSLAESNKSDNEDWKAKHAISCSKNFDGSSNAMEVECAKRLWGRSVEKHKLRYMTMLSDGDSKSYDAVCQARVYGSEKLIQKEDCINHVSKRMGTALRKLVDVSKAQGKSISGRGKMTKEKILKIQNFYGRAVKDNANDIPLLKKRIFAILFHMSSSDQHPKHMHCPPGEKSWCFFQRSIAKSEQPGSHKHHDTISAEVGKQLVPIFERLTEPDLLKRCTRAMTQNANESLHNMIWKICPKTIFVGRKTMETAVAIAACQFSMGATFKVALCKALGVDPGSSLVKFAARESRKRVELAEKAASTEAKKRRKQLKFRQTDSSKTQKESEGITYAAGAF